MEIFGIGLGEMLIIAVVAVIILGPERLPEAARQVGKLVRDFRRATEPARSALQEITAEINKTADSITTTINQKPSGNPWEVHPILQGMTDEEREVFMAGGPMPERLANQMDDLAVPRTSSNGTAPGELSELDYPEPHDTRAGRSSRSAPELLDYPPPGG
jgi:Tat protein translocase TatB subunit